MPKRNLTSGREGEDLDCHKARLKREHATPHWRRRGAAQDRESRCEVCLASDSPADARWDRPPAFPAAGRRDAQPSAGGQERAPELPRALSRKPLLGLHAGIAGATGESEPTTDCWTSSDLPNQQIQSAHIEVGLSVVLPGQLEKTETVLVCRHAAVRRLV